MVASSFKAKPLTKEDAGTDGLASGRKRAGAGGAGGTVECLQVRTRGKAPEVGEGNPFLAQLEGELLRLSCNASGPAVVHDAYGNRVLARFQETSGNGIFTHRVMMTGILVAPHPSAIDPGDVHVVDLTEEQDCLGLGLFSGQFDGFAKPHHSIVAG